MKKFVFSFLVACALALSAAGQAYVPAGSVSLVDTNFTYLFHAGTNSSLYVAPTSRTFRTVQHLADWVDDLFFKYWPDGYVMPGTNMYDSVYTNNQWLVMKGTNAYRAHFNSSVTGALAQTWYVLPGTNIQDGVYDTNSYQWILGAKVGTNSVTNYSFAANSFTSHASKIYIDGSFSSDAPIVPVGAVMSFARPTAPKGWLPCDGGLYYVSNYPALYEAIGTNYGGTGISTFRVPDLRGEFVRGWDDARGVDSGRAWASWQSNMFLEHSHYLNVTGDVSLFVALHPSAGTVSNSLNDSGSDFIAAQDYEPPCVVTGNTYSVGGSETRPRNLVLLYCIKY